MNVPMLRRLKRGLVALLLVTLTSTAAAAVGDVSREEFNISTRMACVIAGMSLLGGLASWIRKVQAGDVTRWSVMNLIGELAISGFAGLLCYLLCDAAGMPIKLIVCLVGISGHMGSKAIAAFERFAEKKWGALTGEGPPGA